MKVIEIKQDSIVDGEGLRTVIFFSGCPHFCPGCHNPKSWNVSNGYDYTVDQLLEIAMKNPLMILPSLVVTLLCRLKPFYHWPKR